MNEEFNNQSCSLINPIYVINMSKSIRRREKVEEGFLKAKIDFRLSHGSFDIEQGYILQGVI